LSELIYKKPYFIKSDLEKAYEYSAFADLLGM